jgi:prophage regulatory protein
MRVLTKDELRDRVPFSDVHIARLEGRGLFPRRIRLGANRVGWLEHEIDEWLAARAAERDSAPPAEPNAQRVAAGRKGGTRRWAKRRAAEAVTAATASGASGSKAA